MPMFRWGNAFDAFRDIEREFDRLLQTVATQSVRAGARFPLVNLYERPEEFLLLVQLPGVEKEQLDLTIADGRLTVKGERTRPDDVDESQYRRSERPIGRWERTVALPDRVDEENISADFREGLLQLTLPKLETTPARQIQVRMQDSSNDVDSAGQNERGATNE